MEMKNTKIMMMILLGNLILAFAVACFTLPLNIVVGGTTGLGLIGKALFNLPISYTVMIVNVTLFVVGYFALGKTFALTTLVSTFVYPVFLEIIQSIPYIQTISNDILLSTIFGGALSGIGIGLVIRAGASTGGMDIPPIILHKKFGFNVSAMVNLCDGLIIVALIVVYPPIQLLYGILSTVIMSYAINKVLILGENNMQLLVISKKYEQIREAFIHELDYGVSLIKMETGFTKEDSKAVLCVIPPRKIASAKETINKIDDHAFVTISPISEVRGKGFTLDREYLKTNIS
ncbi:YitT family protein [Erysipelatoclostridium sp. AM42-17]|nr:YitT family protein [Coprobacillus sp. AF33-1AC]RHS91557.1 YitT family protein [Erysipelatoclostridium sp. AM42-17]